MNLTLHLSAELEAKLREQAKAEGKPLEDVALEALQDKLVLEEEGRLPRDKWHARFDAFLASIPHTNATFVDDSRESIYEGRGE
jgi:hypothetical protein